MSGEDDGALGSSAGGGLDCTGGGVVDIVVVVVNWMMMMKIVLYNVYAHVHVGCGHQRLIQMHGDMEEMGHKHEVVDQLELYDGLHFSQIFHDHGSQSSFCHLCCTYLSGLMQHL